MSVFRIHDNKITLDKDGVRVFEVDPNGHLLCQNGTMASMTALGGSLRGYATTADLADYVQTADLADYATVESLGDYVVTATLADYATTDDLSDYALTTALSAFPAYSESTYSNVVWNDGVEGEPSWTQTSTIKLRRIGAVRVLTVIPGAAQAGAPVDMPSIVTSFTVAEADRPANSVWTPMFVVHTADAVAEPSVCKLGHVSGEVFIVPVAPTTTYSTAGSSIGSFSITWTV